LLITIDQRLDLRYRKPIALPTRDRGNEELNLRKLLQISRAIDTLNEWVGRLTYGLVLLMVLVGVWNVFGRYLGKLVGQNLTSNALIEIQWYLFDLVFLLGGAYALKHNDHVRVDLFYKDWHPRRRALVNFIGTILFLIPFCGLVIYYSWGNVVNSWQIKELSPDPGGLPRYPIKSFIIVSLVLLILQGISETIKNWIVFRSEEEGDREL
jgi:TRAP-type mannitol/chloroaromatic compound transport system permease small subunit